MSPTSCAGTDDHARAFRQNRNPKGCFVRALIQRVSQARVEVDGNIIGQIKHGLLVLVCAMQGDTEAEAAKLAAAAPVPTTTEVTEPEPIVPRESNFDRLMRLVEGEN